MITSCWLKVIFGSIFLISKTRPSSPRKRQKSHINFFFLNLTVLNVISIKFSRSTIFMMFVYKNKIKCYLITLKTKMTNLISHFTFKNSFLTP